MATLFMLREKGYYPLQHSANELYQGPKANPVLWTWKDNLYPPEEVDIARRLSADSILINKSTLGDLQKLKDIVLFLHLRLHTHLGNPSPELRKRSPWQQYLAVYSGQQDFYCTNYSAILAFFCRANGLAVREIEIKGKNDRHIYCEVYIPSLSSWVMADPTNNFLLPHRGPTYLNTVQFLRILHTEPTTLHAFCVRDKQMIISSGDSLLQPIFYNFDKGADYYFYNTPDLHSLASPSDKIRRFLFNQPAVMYYNEHKKIFTAWILVKYLVLALSAWAIVQLFRGLLIMVRDVKSKRST